MPDLTICVGIDRKTIEQLKVSWPTWQKHRPEMWTYPWLVFHNGLFPGEAEAMADVMGLDAKPHPADVGLASTVQVIAWPPPLTKRSRTGRDQSAKNRTSICPAPKPPAAWSANG